MTSRADGLTPTNDIAAVATAVSTELAEAVAGLELTAIVADRKRLRSADAFGDEIERITIGLYQVMRGRRTAIMVLDRCACEIPELATVWFGDGRYALVDLWHDYLTQRAGHLSIDVDPAILARTIVELVTTWAVKMPWDPAPRPYPDDTAAACATMIRHLLTGPADERRPRSTPRRCSHGSGPASPATPPGSSAGSSAERW